MHVIHCSRTVFGEGKTSSGIFQFSGFRLKETMRAVAKKMLGRSRQNPISGVDMSIMLQNEELVFCSLNSRSAWEQEEVCEF